MYPTSPARKRRVAIRALAAVMAAAATALLGGVVAPSASAAAGDTHIFTATNTEIFDAVQPAGSTSFLPLDRVSRTAGPYRSQFPETSAVTVGNTVHLLATGDQTLLHTMRRNDGTWTPYTTVPIDGVGIIFRVTAVNVGGQLQAVIHSGSQVFHAARSNSTGAWTPFIDVETQAGRLGDFFTSIVDATAVGTILGRMELVVQTDGAFYHTTRRNNGTWDGWDKVSDNTGNPGNFFWSFSMTLASVGSDVHLITIGTGAPFHAVRSPDGSWTRFANVYGQTGNPTGGAITRLATAGMSGGRLTLAMQTTPTSTLPAILFSTIREADGTWAPFRAFPGPADAGLVDSLTVASE